MRQFWGIAIPYWRHEEKWKATGLLVLLVALLLGLTGFAELFNEQTGEFTSALAAHNSDRIWQAIRWCLVCGLRTACVREGLKTAVFRGSLH